MNVKRSNNVKLCCRSLMSDSKHIGNQNILQQQQRQHLNGHEWAKNFSLPNINNASLRHPWDRVAFGEIELRLCSTWKKTANGFNKLKFVFVRVTLHIFFRRMNYNRISIQLPLSLNKQLVIAFGSRRLKKIKFVFQFAVYKLELFSTFFCLWFCPIPLKSEKFAKRTQSNNIKNMLMFAKRTDFSSFFSQKNFIANKFQLIFIDSSARWKHKFQSPAWRKMNTLDAQSSQLLLWIHSERWNECP